MTIEKFKETLNDEDKQVLNRWLQIRDRAVENFVRDTIKNKGHEVGISYIGDIEDYKFLESDYEYTRVMIPKYINRKATQIKRHRKRRINKKLNKKYGAKYIYSYENLQKNISPYWANDGYERFISYKEIEFKKIVICFGDYQTIIIRETGRTNILGDEKIIYQKIRTRIYKYNEVIFDDYRR